MANRLATETSPYLLQHAGNPVDWQPWDDQALEQARREQKPIFLSVGYAACHWCHVMERESFEDRAIAGLLNAHFVNIKVDREERPDLDQTYMQAVQLLTGRGGWPMSVFLTPDLEPFAAGTYWPPEPRMGMPGFRQVVEAVVDAWTHRRDQVVRQGQMLADRIRQLSQPAGAAEAPGGELLERACQALDQAFDERFGGFGQAPKFPHPMDLQLLMRVWKREGRQRLLQIVQVTLDRMAAGGIYDQVGGGFARYSVDPRWLVPHFEKMLYDNALLAQTYLEAFQLTGNQEYERIARETLEYLLRDMTDPLGGFHSSEDADSEGEEGRFYVWTPQEIRQALGEELAERFCYVYDVTEEGNFEGRNILHRAHAWTAAAAARGWDPEELERQMGEARRILLEVRSDRVRPGKDDKVLVNWNALVIRALALAAGVLDDAVYLAAAQRAAYFLHAHLWEEGDRLWHSWRDGQARVEGFLDDYACLIDALVDLYQADLDENWIAWAVDLSRGMLDRFRDPQQGDFYFTAPSHRSPIVRTRDVFDSSVPSATGMAATALLRLGRLTGDPALVDAGYQALVANGPVLAQSPMAAGQMLLALDTWLGPDAQWVIYADRKCEPTRQWLAQVRRNWLPHVLLAVREADESPSRPPGPLDPIFAGRQPAGPLPAIYVCRGQACEAPRYGLPAAQDLLAGH